MSLAIRMNPISLFALIILFMGSSAAMAASPGQDQTTKNEVRKEIDEALQAVGSYSAEQRDEALAKAEEALLKTDAQIEQLQQRIDQKWQQMSQAAREGARKSLKTLQRQRNEIAEWYGGLKHSSSSAWEEIKNGFSKSYSALLKSLDKAYEEF